MRISRLYINSTIIGGQKMTLDKEASHYLKNVLRHHPGDPLAIFNENDGEFIANIIKTGKSEVIIDVQQQSRAVESVPVKIHLGQGIARGEKMDFVIQKATELGVDAITPLLTERCNVKLPDERMQKRMGHWQRIAIHASEQSGRCRVPSIMPASTLDAWLRERDESVRLLCHPGNDNTHIQQTPTSIALCIGPEGGLSDAERASAWQYHFQPLNLGPRILRTETAALAAITLCQCRFGDIP